MVSVEHPRVASQIEFLSAWIEAQMAYAAQPGLSIGIVYDQQLIWARGFGFADLEQQLPATPHTLYRIASITKTFTATALLQLRDAGRLQLDDPLTRYLPWFSVQTPYPEAPSITIRHLLTHTSGLPRESASPYWTDNQFPTREQLQAALGQQQAALGAETQWKYSNLALALAGEVVTAVSGQPYPDYIEQHILKPLDMQHTLVRTPGPGHPGLATGYSRRLPGGTRQVSPLTDTKGLTPAANMTTSVEDLARFAMLQFRDGPAGGAQILRGSTLREMQRVHWLEPNWEAGWGLGFRILRKDGKTYVGHGGAVLGYRTQLLFCPADKIAAMVLTNSDDGNPLLYAEKAFQWVAPAILEASAPEAQAAPADWQQYMGKYRSAWGDSQVLWLEGGLVMIDPSLADPLPTLVRLVPVGEHSFRMESKNGFGSNGELLRFELDPQGRAVRMITGQGQNQAQRVDSWS